MARARDAARAGRTCSRSAPARSAPRSAAPKYRVNVNTLEHAAATTLELNEIGVCNLNLDRPIAFDPYAREPRHGRLRPHRPAHERDRRRRAAALRAAPVAERPLAGARGRQGGARRAQGPPAVRGVVHRSVRRGQVDASPTWSRSGCTRSACTRPCSTATTSGTGSTRTSASPRPTGSRTSAGSPRCRG